jgi:hypothetical protein
MTRRAIRDIFAPQKKQPWDRRRCAKWLMPSYAAAGKGPRFIRARQ